MKIIFTGGGSGGHFYPIIAIAESIAKLSKENKLIPPKLYFFSPNAYNPGLLYDHNIEYKKVTAGKLRRYFSFMNFVDIFKMFWGTILATLDVFDIFPDVVFGKGAYGSFPSLMAARILGIPVFIHESDTVPGRVNKWAGKFAKRIAVSYKDAAAYFPAEKVAYTGQPIIEEHLQTIENGAFEFFNLDQSIPTILVLGGSQGAEVINNAILDSLSNLLENFQIIHQTGQAHFEVIKESADSILLESKYRNRYKPYPYLNNLEMRMAAGCSSIVVSRAGSTIFEIASWAKPSIIIPISDSNQNHQVKNAFAYAQNGACSVIKEENLKTHILISEIKRILEQEEVKNKMIESTKSFSKKDASDSIARELLTIAMSHEKL